MKIISNKVAAGLICVATLVSSCLKDKGFEDQRFGIDMDKQPFPQSVSFPSASNSVSENLFTVDLKPQPQDILAPTVAVTIKDPLPYDVTVNLVRKDSLVLANNQNINRDFDLTVMPFDAYRFPSLKVTIPAGQTTGALKIVIVDATKLSIDEVYGFGFQIASVDQAGFNIAGNLKNVLIGVNVANKYDGIYRAKGYTFLGNASTAPFTFNYLCTSPYADFATSLRTAGPDRVEMNYQPIARNGGIALYTDVRPAFVFDVNTNKVVNVLPHSGSIPFRFPWAGNPTYDSRYDPVTKTIYVQYGIQVANPASVNWVIVDTLVYCGPR